MSKKILVVDDVSINIDIISAILEENGYDDIDTCLNARIACDAIINRTSLYDLIITDISMPGMDGISFIKELKENNITTPIIAMNSMIDDYLELQTYKAGAFLFIQRPYNPDIFIYQVNNILERVK